MHRSNDPVSVPALKLQIVFLLLGFFEDLVKKLLNGQDVNYLKPGNNRNLAIVPLNDKMRAFNYAYFVTTEFDVDSDPNVLAIMFTSHNVTFKGYGLINLFWDLFNSTSRIVTAIDSCYVPEEQDKDSYTVIEISVEQNA